MAKLITVERPGVAKSEAVIQSETKKDSRTFDVTTDVPRPRNFDKDNDILEYYDGSGIHPLFKIIKEYGITKFRIQRCDD